ncbi:MAG: TIGR03915 family putative DNA repair protein [Flavobacteriaceae bacterium]
MENAKIYIYDGSFNGFLTAIFIAFERNEAVSDFRPDTGCQSTLFLETETITTHLEYAKRVWNGIQAKSSVAVKQVYFSFLSEHPGIEQLLYRFIQNLFHGHSGKNTIPFGHIDLKIGQLASQVAKEKGKLEAFLTFEPSVDNILYTIIDPHFNVLPLLSKHFRLRLTGQEWLIYDYKRKYGLHSNGKAAEFIKLELWRMQGAHDFMEDNVPRTLLYQVQDWKMALRSLPLTDGIVPQTQPYQENTAKSDFYGVRKAI